MNPLRAQNTEPKVQSRGERLAVRCCQSTSPTACFSEELGGLGDPSECSGLMT